MFETKDTRVEGLLKRLGKYGSLVIQKKTGCKFDDLKPGWDQRNMARPSSKVREAIATYRQQMDAGSKAPPTILRVTTLGYEVADGIQRLCASHERGEKTFPAYVIKCDELMARKVRLLSNHVLQGYAEKPEWTRRQAVQIIIIEDGGTAADLAEISGWSIKAIEEDERFLRCQFKIKQAGGPEMTKGTVLDIAEATKPIDFEVAGGPIAAFCETVRNAKLSNGEAKPFVQKVFRDLNRKDRKNLHRQIARRVEKFQDDDEVKIRLPDGRRQKSPRADETKLLQVLKAARTVTEEFCRTKAKFRYMEEYFQVHGQTGKNLKTIAKHSKAKVTN